MAVFLARFKTFRTFAIASVLLGLMPAETSACLIAHQINIFFDRAPKDINDFVALEVTLVDVKPFDKELFLGIARIDSVINGHVASKIIKLFVTGQDPCGTSFSGQRHGIVVGTIRSGDELVAMSQTEWNTRTRLRALQERNQGRGDK